MSKHVLSPFQQVEPPFIHKG